MDRVPIASRLPPLRFRVAEIEYVADPAALEYRPSQEMLADEAGYVEAVFDAPEAEAEPGPD